jgi:intraflagellar transport protein 80
MLTACTGVCATDKDVVSAVCWAPFGELYTCSDDNTICRWSRAGECLGTVCKIEDTNVTDIHWFPSVGTQVSDLFAVSCTDGTFMWPRLTTTAVVNPRLPTSRWHTGDAVVPLLTGSFRIISKTGREEKKVEASSVAAILSLRWNHDGSAVATAGEDGAVKVWSRSGMLRSTMATFGTCTQVTAPHAHTRVRTCTCTRTR